MRPLYPHVYECGGTQNVYILTFCCALLGFGAMAMAQDTQTTVSFTYTNDGTNATITGVTLGEGETTLTIPGTVTGTESGQSGQTYTVVAIGDRAFHSQTSITSVTIPNSVTSIGNDAFANCTSLQTVTFGDNNSGVTPTSLRLKGESGDESTSSLLTIGSSAFNGDVALTEITIPASVTSIGNDAFAGCTTLESVTFEEGSACASIGSSCFNGCSSLTAFAFPAGVTVVANDILAGCTSLESVTFSTATTEIGGSAFASCEALTGVTLPSTLTTIGNYCFGESGLTTITIPESVTSIGDMAFAYLTFDESGVTNNSSVELTSSMFYKSNVETDYMEWDELNVEVPVDKQALSDLITWESLEDYRYIKFVITYNEESTDYGSWAGAKVYSGIDANSGSWIEVCELGGNEFKGTEEIYKISELKGMVDEKVTGNESEGFYLSAWSPATAVTLLADPKVILPENKAYNFDDEAFASLQAQADYVFEKNGNPEEVGGVTFIQGDSENLKFQANDGEVMVGEDEDGKPITISPSYRVSLGGGGSTSKVAISIPVEGSCTLYVVAASSGSAGRYLMVSDGTDIVNPADDYSDSGNSSFEVCANTEEATTNCLFSCEYEGDATDLYLYSKSSGICVFYIYVSYDGTEPDFSSTTDDGSTGEGDGTWTLTEHTKVGYESITWEELEGYDAVKFVLYYDGDHTGWGMGGIYTFADGNNAVYAWTGTYDVDEFIITVDDLKELCDVTESGFAYNTWSPCVTIEVYFGVGSFTTGVYEGTSTAISNVNVDAVEVARYNLMGQKLSGAERGINIIVYSDGSAKKVLVK